MDDNDRAAAPTDHPESTEEASPPAAGLAFEVCRCSNEERAAQPTLAAHYKAVHAVDLGQVEVPTELVGSLIRAMPGSFQIANPDGLVLLRITPDGEWLMDEQNAPEAAAVLIREVRRQLAHPAHPSAGWAAVRAAADAEIDDAEFRRRVVMLLEDWEDDR